MQLHELRNKKKSKKRIARGGAHGKTSGRGTKGQKSRAGRKIRPAERDMIKRIPKLRGYRFKSIVAKHAVVNLSAINSAFASGDVVTPESLAAHGLIEKRGTGFPLVKVLGGGIVEKKLTVERCFVSASAKEKIEKAGGAVKE
ncbi:MAG: 50S ribosomal protein L15 [Candidatus Azambacteria bacterium]|nr:50S ribosomal protein L15 [Candidatus Azambacteria bacterium]